jgi:hypothetical protein
MSKEESIAITNTITKKRKRFASPIVARVFHKYSQLRISITDSIGIKLLKVLITKGLDMLEAGQNKI